MNSIFAPDLQPMPDTELSMFQFDDIGFLSGLLSRPAHCKEISIGLTADWEIINKYGRSVKTHIGDFIELDKARLLSEHSFIKCGWRDSSSGTVLAISHFDELGRDLQCVQEQIASELLPRNSLINHEVRDLRASELRLVKGREPKNLIQSKFQGEEGCSRIFTASYTSHAQPGIYTVSAVVPIPVEKPLALMRVISYSFARFWVLPRPYGDGTVVVRRRRGASI